MIDRHVVHLNNGGSHGDHWEYCRSVTSSTALHRRVGSEQSCPRSRYQGAERSRSSNEGRVRRRQLLSSETSSNTREQLGRGSSGPERGRNHRLLWTM